MEHRVDHTKTYTQLNLEERIEIYRLRAGGISLWEIDKTLSRSPATISRELRRNGKGQGGYHPQRADDRYRHRHARGRTHKLSRLPELRQKVLDQLSFGWSPEQISGRLRENHRSEQISYESIYRYIYWRAYHFRGADADIYKHLPKPRRKRRSRTKNPHRTQPPIPGRLPISQRPAGAINRSRYGHWEADLMSFSHPGKSVLVLHDRRARYTCLAPINTKKAPEVIDTLQNLFATIPRHRRKTVTFDNGQEFCRHQELTRAKAIQTFFCAPRAPWEKGGVEHNIKRLRRFLPRQTDLAQITPERLASLMEKVNNTPRKCLNFKTPNEAFFNKSVALQT